MRAPEPDPASLLPREEAGLPISIWSAIEHTWLGLASPPLAERSAAEGWHPDDPGAYCWRCGRSAGAFAVGADGCSECESTRVPWARVVRLGSYLPPLSALVREVKFTAFPRLGVDLGRLLGSAIASALREAVAEGRLAPGPRVEIVPVPTSFRRRLARGIDHAAAIARGVAGVAPTGETWRVRPDLSRSHRPSQLSVNPSGRARNVAGSMRPSARGQWRRNWSAWRARESLTTPSTGQVSRVTVLIDDVMTTGATMREACRAYRLLYGTADTELWAGVLAVTPPRGENAREA